MIFFNTQDAQQEELESKISALVEAEGQQVIGWRTVPVDDTHIGIMAKDVKPFVRQLFVGKGEKTEKGLPFERKLYVIRKRRRMEQKEMQQHLYFASFSSETIVYKGMLTSVQVDSFSWIYRIRYLKVRLHLCTLVSVQIHSQAGNMPIQTVISSIMGKLIRFKVTFNWMRARQKQFVSKHSAKTQKKSCRF